MDVTIINHTVRKNFALDFVEYAILDHIAWAERGSKGRGCGLLVKHITAWAGHSDRTTHRVLKKLKKAELLEKMSTKYGKRFFVAEAWWRAHELAEAQEDAQEDSPTPLNQV